jgi:hypothetical protein
MITPSLAERLVDISATDVDLATSLIEAVRGPDSAAAYIALPPEQQELRRIELMGNLVVADVEQRVMLAVEAWEAKNIRTIDTAGLEEADLTVLERRRFIRGLVSALKYSELALKAIAQRYPFFVHLFKSAMVYEDQSIARLETFVFDQVGRDVFAAELAAWNGYDIEVDIHAYKPVDAVGEVLTIPAEDRAFKEAIRARRHWVYNKLAVTPTTVDNKPYWLVFFA